MYGISHDKPCIIHAICVHVRGHTKTTHTHTQVVNSLTFKLRSSLFSESKHIARSTLKANDSPAPVLCLFSSCSIFAFFPTFSCRINKQITEWDSACVLALANVKAINEQHVVIMTHCIQQTLYARRKAINEAKHGQTAGASKTHESCPEFTWNLLIKDQI